MTTRKPDAVAPTGTDASAEALDALNQPDATADFWAALCAPFSADEIELLPKPFAKDSPKGDCRPDRNGLACGGYHGLPAVHLSYVGHAGITDRLNDVCGPDGWGWEPFALDQRGLPLVADGGLWIRLWVNPPVGRVEKIGYGDAPGKNNATKELIGDALRNAAMRFGIGTYLWGKSDKAKATLERGDAEAKGTGEPEPEHHQQQPQRQQRSTPGHERPPHVVAFYEAFAALDALDQATVRSRWTDRNLPSGGPDHLTVEEADRAALLIAEVKAERIAREVAARQGNGEEPAPF